MIGACEAIHRAVLSRDEWDRQLNISLLKLIDSEPAHHCRLAVSADKSA
jgi:hypothetical protein